MPGQIDWAMRDWEHFCIDIDSFKGLAYTPISDAWITLHSNLHREIKKKARHANLTEGKIMPTNNQINQEIDAIIDPQKLNHKNNCIKYSLYFIERFKPNLFPKEFKFSEQAIQKNNEKYQLYINQYNDQIQERESSNDCLSDEEYVRLLSARDGYYNGWSRDEIDDAFEGDPEATWNVD